MRVDARRNQVRILEAARAQITQTGSDVSMEQIAKTAGVAVGTLYRHYPTKTDLVQAVLTEFSGALVNWVEEASQTLAAPGDAMARIVTLLTDFVEEAAHNQAVKEAALVFDAAYLTPELEDRGRRALQILVAAARTDGNLRDGVTADDIFLLMLSAPSTLPQTARARWLNIILTAIRPG
ncbi:helix-turn-helix domain-containing protein [Glaciihabitans sp. UYNi722]|uniref:TetR/AcrR family transcriptional regulator n=1 Tax=Glaciihabitans sp. UYNi722 TaxID=3156344 RepID=UPI003395AFDC